MGRLSVASLFCELVDVITVFIFGAVFGPVVAPVVKIPERVHSHVLQLYCAL
jgi:hypothetical protein